MLYQQFVQISSFSSPFFSRRAAENTEFSSEVIFFKSPNYPVGEF